MLTVLLSDPFAQSQPGLEPSPTGFEAGDDGVGATVP
jgi:hypothetical protein